MEIFIKNASIDRALYIANILPLFYLPMLSIGHKLLNKSNLPS